MSSLDLSWVASITSTTREGRETGRCACLLGNAGHDLRLSTRSFAGQIPARFGPKMAPPAAVTKIHWSHFQLDQSSISIIAANRRRTRLTGVAVHTFVHYYVHMPQTIRIAPSVHATLATLAKATHTTIAETVSRAVGVYQREVFFRGLADDFAALRASSEQWPGEQAEREAWDETIADGLEKE